MDGLGLSSIGWKGCVITSLRHVSLLENSLARVRTHMRVASRFFASGEGHTLAIGSMLTNLCGSI